ncbi:MAG: hypothetical protein GPJ54_10005 [Candidatus Heimdallarchaeota archaeon]|nr:hypothetical protein [Candidatus Heimdallarchaeota archaeon]
MANQRIFRLFFSLGIFYSTILFTIQGIILQNIRDNESFNDWIYDWRISLSLTDISLSLLFAWIIYIVVKRSDESLFSNIYEKTFLNEIMKYYIAFMLGYLVLIFNLLLISLIADESTASNLGKDIISFYGLFNTGGSTFDLSSPMKTMILWFLYGTNLSLLPLLVLVTSNIVIHQYSSNKQKIGETK